MKLGIFDSGRGGEFVAERLKIFLPDYSYTVINDLAHAPYGERSSDELIHLTEAAIQPLLDCDHVVIACNTATAAAIDYLRTKYPTTSFIGFEPMIKPAADITLSRRVTLLATKATAESSRTKELTETFAHDITIDVPSTIGWATAIDHNQTDSIAFTSITESIDRGSDTIILGCTHYIALIPRLRQHFPKVTILEPSEAVARRISQPRVAQPPQ